MPDNELFIYLRVEVQRATQASRAYHQGEHQRINETASVHEKAYNRMVADAKKAAKEKIDLDKTVESSGKKAVAAVESERKKADRDADRDTKQAARDQIKLENEITASYFKNQNEKARRRKAIRADEERADKGRKQGRNWNCR